MAKDNSSPILVLNPYSESRINVEPVFYFLDINGVKDAFENCDTAIRYLAMASQPFYFNDEDRQNIMMFLYEVRDMFQGLAECNIPIAGRKKINK